MERLLFKAPHGLEYELAIPRPRVVPCLSDYSRHEHAILSRRRYSPHSSRQPLALLQFRKRAAPRVSHSKHIHIKREDLRSETRSRPNGLDTSAKRKLVRECARMGEPDLLIQQHTHTNETLTGRATIESRSLACHCLALIG